LYLHHVGIYCFRRAALERFASFDSGVLEQRESLEQLRAIENGMVVGLVVTDRQTVSVDRPGDVDLVVRRMKAP
jgi:3-deoxy-manno-octulosonate cytidylyltransferase (CMP-KDO synthetase)